MTNHSHKHHPLVMSSPKQRQGSYFEQQASQFLQGHGLIFIAKNWQQPKVGEIDLVMLEVGQAWSTLVFIEVRQRRRSSFGNAALSVTKAKQRKIINTAKYFLQQYPEYADYECRFDVIAYDLARDSSYATDKGKNTDNEDAENSRNDMVDSHQPEWLSGAFIANAW
ncbi:YraN family protein [Psychrobacter sp. H8-1]|uniref:YraN family protein n=1 Tax=Psychrobacter sp. H8-1 TaxID=2774129 RepID=UPI001917AA4A|nr:YraN family protein [Psychrobacter sp. H8-1]